MGFLLFFFAPNGVQRRDTQVLDMDTEIPGIG